MQEGGVKTRAIGSPVNFSDINSYMLNFIVIKVRPNKMFALTCK